MDGIVCIDKPVGFTSFDVVAKCRGILGERKIGHGGTLDPMATGVLPLFLGRATAVSDLTYHQDKAYDAELQLGVATDTYDITGTVTERRDASGITLEDLAAVLPRFRGTIRQVPPLYSAVQVNGERLYKAARSGREVEVPSREVTVSQLEAFEREGRFCLHIRCSKGTYVRSIIHDLGQLLGCGAVMSRLRRTEACGFTLADCLTLEQLQTNRNEQLLAHCILPVSSAFADMPRREIPADRLLPFINGLPTRAEDFAPSGLYAAWCGERFLGLGELREDREFYPKKILADPEKLRTECGKDSHAAV